MLFASAVAERQEFVEREQLTQQELYQREHRVAAHAQRSLLPDRIPEALGFEVAARYIPATRDVYVGGDWYDIIPLSEGRLGLVIGDVAGHGVDAAATMGQIRMALRAYALDELAPEQALTRLNRLMRELQPGAMATVLYGHLDPATRDFSFRERRASAAAADPWPARRELRRRGALGAGRGDAERRVPCRVVVVRPGRVARAVHRRVWSSGAGWPIDDRFALLQQAAGEAPDDLEAVCDHLCPRCSTPGRPMTWRCSRFGRSRSSAGACGSTAPRSPRRWRRFAVPSVAGSRENGVGRELAFEVMVAATEAYTNSVQHAYGVAEGTVSVEASIEAAVVTITVSDGGVWKEAAATTRAAGS